MNDRKIGTRVKMNDGYFATCISYNRCDDFDIEFEDGFITRVKSWSSFLRGNTIGAHKKWLFEKSIVGLTIVMRNGLKASIVQYNNSSDLVIEWETGERQRVKSLAHFKEGKIAISSDNSEAKSKERVGEVRIMNCGLSAKIVEYFKAHDITIEWEDGSRSYKKYYTDFVNGSIAYPRNGDLLNQKRGLNKENKIGTTVKMKNGLLATCVDWKSDHSFHIEFQDGVVVYARKWSDFINGTATSSYETLRREINQKMKMVVTARNGQKMWIQKYNGWNNITVEFEDGTVVEHQRFEKFKNGEVVNPNVKIKAHTSMNEYFIQQILEPYGFRKHEMGSLRHLNFGQMELDCFNEEKMIAIEYDGEIHSFRPNTDLKKNEACQKAGICLIRIREGKLGPLNSTSIDFVVKNCRPLNSELQLVLMDVIRTINKLATMNIDPQIAIIQNQKEIYNQFNKIYINPHIGEKRISKDGCEGVLIRYRHYSSVDIQLDNGEERTMSYHNFNSGNFYQRKSRAS